MADYGWFKDALKVQEMISKNYSVRLIGYEDENKGALVIGNDTKKIECVTKMPITEIEELIKEIEKLK